MTGLGSSGGWYGTPALAAGKDGHVLLCLSGNPFASFATFRLLFGQNDGVLRGYAVAGVLGGMVFYDRTGSRLLFAVLKKCSGWIKMKRRGKKSQKTGKKRTTRGQAENMERK